MEQNECNSISSYQVCYSQNIRNFGYQLAIICEESNLFGYTESQNIWLQEFQIQKLQDCKSYQYTCSSQKLEAHCYDIYVLEYNSKLKLLVSANLQEMILWQKDYTKQWKNKQTLMISMIHRLIIISDILNQIIYSECRQIKVLQNLEKENICFSQIQLITNQENQICSLTLNEQQDLLFIENYDFEIFILKVKEQKWHKMQRLTNINDSIFIGVKQLFCYKKMLKNLKNQYSVFQVNNKNNLFELINQKEIESREQILDETSFFIAYQTTKCCKVYHSSSKGMLTYRDTIQRFEGVMAVSQKGLYVIRLNFQTEQIKIYIHTQHQ